MKVAACAGQFLRQNISFGLRNVPPFSLFFPLSLPLLPRKALPPLFAGFSLPATTAHAERACVGLVTAMSLAELSFEFSFRRHKQSTGRQTHTMHCHGSRCSQFNHVQQTFNRCDRADVVVRCDWGCCRIAAGSGFCDVLSAWVGEK